MADLETRIRRGLREYADAVPVPSRHPVVQPVAPRSHRPWRYAVVAAASVIVVLVGVALLPGLIGQGDTRPGPTTGGRPRIPDQFAGFSPLTASVSEAPPGRAIAVYTQGGTGPKVFGRQSVVVGADGDLYRRVDIAERRGGVADDGEWGPAPVLLAPLGDRLAVGAASPTDDLAVVDLRSGAERHYPVAATGHVRPLAFSPDGRYLAYNVAPDASTFEGRLTMLDLETGESRPFGAQDLTPKASFSPDGARVAVQVGETVGSKLRVYTRDGRLERDLPLSSHPDATGPLAWSPDGRRIAVTDHSGPLTDIGLRALRIVVLDVTGQGTSPPIVPADDAEHLQLLAWRAADTLLIAGDDALYEVATTGGQLRVLTRLGDGGVEAFPVYDVQIATALLPDAVVRPASDVDRGPWPTWLWPPLIVVGAGVVAFVVLLLLRKPARRQRLRSLLRR